MEGRSDSKPPAYIADHIRRVLKDGGSAPFGEDLQRFFREEITSHGWRTAELRKVAARFRRVLLHDRGRDYLLQVANELFRGIVLDEDAMAVFLIEKCVGDFGDVEFSLFDGWLNRISNWAVHDALVMNVIGPMVTREPRRMANVFSWAKSENVWCRRASAVSLIRGARAHQLSSEIVKVSDTLLNDPDLMVQKGVAWLLREFAKSNPTTATNYLMEIRESAPRFVLRSACEPLIQELKDQVLGVKLKPARAHPARA